MRTIQPLVETVTFLLIYMPEVFFFITFSICNMIIILEQALKEGALFHLDIIRTSKHQAAFRPGAASKGEN